MGRKTSQMRVFPKIAFLFLSAALFLPCLPRVSGLFNSHYVLDGWFLLAGIMASVSFVRKTAAKGAVVSLPVRVLLGAMIMLAGFLPGLIAAPWHNTALVVFSRNAALFVLMIAFSCLDECQWKTVQGVALAGLAVLDIFMLLEMVWTFPTFDICGPFNHANVLAYFLMVFGALGVAYLRRKDIPRWQKHIGVVVLVVAGMLLPLTRSAGVVLIVAALLGGGLIFLALRDGKRWLAAAGISLFVLLSASGAAYLYKLGAVSLVGRTNLIRGAWAMVMKKPVFGFGPGSFLFQYPSHRPIGIDSYPGYSVLSPMNHAHLEPLHTMAEGGVVAVLGLALIVLFVGLNALRLLWQSRHKSVVNWLPLVLFIITAGYGSISLAPSREGGILVAMAFGYILSQVPEGRRVRIKPLLWGMIALILFVGLERTIQRTWSDALYFKGRDQSVYYGAEDLEALKKSVDQWPEALDAFALIAWDEFKQAEKRGPAAEGYSALLTSALNRSNQLRKLAPQYFKENIHRARILRALGRSQEALEALENGDRFRLTPEYEDFRQQLLDDLN